MKIHALSLVLGCVLGGVVTGFIVRATMKPKATPRSDRTVEEASLTATKELEALKTKNQKLTARLAEQKEQQSVAQAEIERLRAVVTATPEPETTAATEPEADHPPTEEEVRKAIDEFGNSLQAIILGRPAGKEAAAKVRKVLLAGGEKTIRRVIEELNNDARDAGSRLVIAHALAQSGDPIALEALKTHLRDPDAGLIMKRFGSHALAFSDAEGLNPILEQAARTSTDTGVRANSAFGLQRRGVEAGVTLYMEATDEAFEKGDPAALQYLSGLSLMGKKVLPEVRKRLGTYKEEQALLVLILNVQAQRDAKSVPALEKLAYDSSQPKSIQKAAQGALDVIKKAAENQ
ncbi:MAG: hypothetical protein OER88_00960 [Planctomycetota bacterium]|nr:hypothetical protein [Planctomycetota bacterium]